MPPEDTSAETEEDSDEESANPNHLSRAILNQVGEVRYDDLDFDIPLSVITRNLPLTSSKDSSSSASKHKVAPRRKKINWSEDVPSYNINEVCNPRRPSD